MIGGVYRYAEDPAANEPPAELQMIWMIDRFGWEAAHTAPAGELKRLFAADNVYRAYQAREAASQTEDGWAGWAEKNPLLSRLLSRASAAAEALELDESEEENED